MPKGLFFCLPSVSVVTTLTPVVNEIALSGDEIVYYNTADFQPRGNFEFRFTPYPEHFSGYYAERIDEHTSYFDFGLILLTSAMELMEFILAELEKEKPDFIIHSHLAVWGKLAAKYYKIPSIVLFTTFILDSRIMLPFFRTLNGGSSGGFDQVRNAMEFSRKYHTLTRQLGLSLSPDLWDIYINRGDLNLSFVLPSFQPQRALFGNDFHFLGYPIPLPAAPRPDKKLIYIAMGTITRQHVSFYQLVIRVLTEMQLESVVAVGNNTDMEQFGHLPSHIRVVNYCDQRAILHETRLFITRAGMASVHEAIYNAVPMIAIPVIPEQQLTAIRIQELGIGIRLTLDQVTENNLCLSIRQILDNYDGYTGKLEKLLAEAPSPSPEKRAAGLVNDCLYKKTYPGTYVYHR